MVNHTVVASDTLFKIAQDNGLTLQELLNANPSIRNPNYIQIGDIINIPSSAIASMGLDPDDLDIIARTIMGEARGETDKGKAAVGWVILNRVAARKWYSGSVFEVCRKPFQFSCWNIGDPNLNVIIRAKSGDPDFDNCLRIAQKVLSQSISDPTDGATHYYANYISQPAWAKKPAKLTVQIGVHLFYKNVD
jgi:N-acetylmuramoyl-L-alanine amidase